MRFFILLPAFAVFLTACETTRLKRADWDVPLTLQTVGPVYADYAIERADANKDGQITLVEWTNAGGTQKSFLLVDQNRDGRVSRTELVRFGSNVTFFDMSRSIADSNKDNQMTPREFRSGSSVRILRIEF